MDIKDGENRATKDETGCERGKFEGKSRCLGVIPVFSRTDGSYQIGAGGENCDGTDPLIAGEFTDSGIPGKIASQLVEDAEKQLAYHQQQAEVITERIHLLRQIVEASNSK